MFDSRNRSLSECMNCCIPSICASFTLSCSSNRSVTASCADSARSKTTTASVIADSPIAAPCFGTAVAALSPSSRRTNSSLIRQVNCTSSAASRSTSAALGSINERSACPGCSAIDLINRRILCVECPVRSAASRIVSNATPPSVSPRPRARHRLHLAHARNLGSRHPSHYRSGWVSTTLRTRSLSHFLECSATHTPCLPDRSHH